MSIVRFKFFLQRKIARFLKMDVTKPQIYNIQVFDEEKQSLEECRNTKKTTSMVYGAWST